MSNKYFFRLTFNVGVKYIYLVFNIKSNDNIFNELEDVVADEGGFNS